MPLPVVPAIIGALSASAAAHGLEKTVEAKSDMDTAKTVNQRAQDIARTAEGRIKHYQTKAKETIEALGAKKIDILSGSIYDFVTTFEQIKHVEFQDSTGLQEFRDFSPQSGAFQQLKKVSFEAKDLAINGLGAVGSGALLAYGTYNVVMSGIGGLLVTATTGTTLASLSGAAAHNATLAWLGGGALSAGGLGMTGGMVVLGGLVVGPAMGLGGTLFAKKAEAAYYTAQTNLEKAKEFEVQAESVCSALYAIHRRASQLKRLLEDLDQPLASLVREMSETIQTRGMDWGRYTVADKRQVKKCVQTAMVVKVVLDTSLLSEDGGLLPDSQKALESGRSHLLLL